MNYILRNLRVPVSSSPSFEAELKKKLRLPSDAYNVERIIRRAVDTRSKNHPYYDYSLELTFQGKVPTHNDLLPIKPAEEPIFTPHILGDSRPVIIGMGPAGLFCALAMVENGLQPIICDRGKALEDRALDVQASWAGADPDPESNVQFGEGGAGTFSDGKLTSRGMDPVIGRVFDLLVEFGADPAIKFEALPHCGTDGIRALVQRIRSYLISKGVEFRYSTCLIDLQFESQSLRKIRLNDDWQDCETLILALGNSARDTFRMLHKRKIPMEAKPFAVGYRIEHHQDAINKAIYGSQKWTELLGPATYRLAHKGVYSFCMCPGGEVIAASSSPGTIVTNGMSYSHRKGKFCNSAIVSGVDEKIYGEGLFAGMDFQERIEKASHNPLNAAPAEDLDSFLSNQTPHLSDEVSYRPAVVCRELSTVYPVLVTNQIKSALQRFGSVLSGFNRDAVLIAPETRTSSPVRITRDSQTRGSMGLQGIFPIGEGSGYAGGIISSAADGFRTGLIMRIR